VTRFSKTRGSSDVLRRQHVQRLRGERVKWTKTRHSISRGIVAPKATHSAGLPRSSDHSTRHGHVFTADAQVTAFARPRPKINGELVVCRAGRLDFTALQGRLASPLAAAVAPASFLAFDVLEAGGTDLRGYPYRVRRVVLEQLLGGAGPPLALVPMTTDATAARAWLTRHLDAGIEGVVAKRLDQPYRLRSSWRKVRGRTSAEAIVGGVLGTISAPVALVLGRPDRRGRLRVVGRTGPIPRHMRAEMGARIRPAGASHPWPPVLPPSRYGGSAPVEYVRVAPEVVVELAVDAAVDVVRGRPVWRHPAKLQRVRYDMHPEDLVVMQRR
jgi:ATP-dependent DNA ligase